MALIIGDGKKLEAHRSVLSEASPFFEKLLGSDMKEAKEGVVSMEMITELGLREVLEFIYTGSVQISAEDNAQDLITLADYLILPHLKDLAARTLQRNLNSSNSLSMYYLEEKFRCEALMSNTRNFILANFTSVTKSEEFFNLSCEEVKMWISRDELHVDCEDDVFIVIVAWIYHNKQDRRKNFSELIREVRLLYTSRDFLQNGIASCDLVIDDESCMYLVTETLKFFDSREYRNRPLGHVKPRALFEVPVLLFFFIDITNEKYLAPLQYKPRENTTHKGHIVCYFLQDKEWSIFPGVPLIKNSIRIVSGLGKLYFASEFPNNKLICYDILSNCWTSLPFDGRRTLHSIFSNNKGEIFALMSDNESSCPDCVFLFFRGIDSHCRKSHLSYIKKYSPESNSWDTVATFDLASRKLVCTVAKDNFIYLIGGSIQENERSRILPDVDRFDLSTNTMEKVADLKVPRSDPYGAAAYGAIFVITGGVNESGSNIKSSEMYQPTINEWLLINDGQMAPLMLTSKCCTCVEGRVYSRVDRIMKGRVKSKALRYYDPDKNEWVDESVMPDKMEPAYFFGEIPCAMKVFKGSRFLQQTLRHSCSALTESTLSPELLSRVPTRKT